jgi:hypothetical protein
VARLWLNASKLSSFRRSTLSDRESLLVSLLARNLCTAASKDPRFGRKRSGDLREPLDFEFELVLLVWSTGLRLNGSGLNVFNLELSLGSVACSSGSLGTLEEHSVRFGGSDGEIGSWKKSISNE